MRHKHTYATSNYDDIRSKPHAQRFDKTCNKFFDIAEVVTKSKDKCVVDMNVLDELMESVSKGDSVCANSQTPRETSTTMPSVGESQVLSPIAIQSKGHPPFKRKALK